MTQSSMATGEMPMAKKTRRPVEGSHDCSICAADGTQCDRQRPYCSQCLGKGRKTCPGYSVSLAWNNGIASRGLKAGWLNPATPANKKGDRKTINSDSAVLKSAHAECTANHQKNMPELDARQPNWPVHSLANETRSVLDGRRESDGSEPDLSTPTNSDRATSSPNPSSATSIDTCGDMPWYSKCPDMPLPCKERIGIDAESKKRRRAPDSASRLWYPPARSRAASPSLLSAQASWHPDLVGMNSPRTVSGSVQHSGLPQSPTSQPMLPLGTPQLAQGLDTFSVPLLDMDIGTSASSSIFDGTAVPANSFSPLSENTCHGPHSPLVAQDSVDSPPQRQSEFWPVYQPLMQQVSTPQPGMPQPGMPLLSPIQEPVYQMTAFASTSHTLVSALPTSYGGQCMPASSPTGLQYQSGFDQDAFPPLISLSLPNRQAPHLAHSQRRSRAASAQDLPPVSRQRLGGQPVHYIQPVVDTTLSLAGSQPATPNQLSPIPDQSLSFDQAILLNSHTPNVVPLWGTSSSRLSDKSVVAHENSWPVEQQQQQQQQLLQPIEGRMLSKSSDNHLVGNRQEVPGIASKCVDDVLLHDSWNASPSMDARLCFEDPFLEMQQAQWPDNQVGLVCSNQPTLKTSNAWQGYHSQDAIGAPEFLQVCDLPNNIQTQPASFDFVEFGFTDFSATDRTGDDDEHNASEAMASLELVPTGISPFAQLQGTNALGLSYQAHGKVMHRLLDYYVNNICPWIVVEDSKNPYKEYVVAGAVQSPVLLHAVAALVVNNIRKRKEQTPGFFGDIPELGDLEVADTFHYQHCADLMKATLANDAVDQTQKAACIIAMTIICLRSVCDSAHADFALQTKLFCQALRRSYIGRQSSFRMFNVSFWCWFDVMNSVINCRPPQMLLNDVDWTELQTGLSRMEQFCGCDERLFKAIAKLGHLIQLSRGKYFATEAEHAAHCAAKKVASEAKDVRESNNVSYPPPRSRRSLNRSTHKAVSHAKTLYFFGVVGPTDPDDRKEFWSELRAVKSILQDWTPKDPAPPAEQAAAAAQWGAMANSNQAFRYAAMLIVARLELTEDDTLAPSRDPRMAHLVACGMHAIEQLLRSAPGPGQNPAQLKFLLWPLFVLGSEAVREPDRAVIRALCRDIYFESGFRNNVDILALLEQIWVVAAHESEGENEDEQVQQQLRIEGAMRRQFYDASRRCAAGGVWEHGVALSWYGFLQRPKAGEWIII